ncbi:hypothetical protein CYQ88_07135 [Hydrogenovibrio sp. SC-1]|uniref:CobW family GTP-binding protein n=1 Tax=Hydrogenovibrio sp. SC-1 TaxID=2065820 RepID=UPI000C7BBD5F|nr:GTP-binding protein [Hydrogenovibrio sp. SC-1]PLA74284.1 hypothetical protein CYQ88_07135 [Hydrogenovibrio sp. SC-1]
MEKTSSQPIPVTLITGLLGSGKTTAINSLLQQKPKNETWGLLINELGKVGIDSLVLQTTQQPIEVVSGGCICCSAAFGYQQALQSLLKQPLQRILIEPTGLGHPAKIIDTLRKFQPTVKLEQTLCMVTPQQLTPDFWQKSAVLRDLVSLADRLLLNKVDTATEAELSQAKATLNQGYPANPNPIFTLHGNPIDNKITDWLTQPAKRPFYRLEGIEQHQQLTQQHPLTVTTSLSHCITLEVFTGDTSSIGWQFSPTVQFNRVALKAFLKHTPHLIRAKSILRTGNEWQHLNHLPNQTSFEDIAWRQDSRLTLLLDQPLNIEQVSKLEQNLTKIVRNCDD